MDINAMTGSSVSANVQDVSSVFSVSRPQADGAAACGPRADDDGDARVSPMGQMLSKLDSLATSDPEKFKALTAQISETLTAAAGQAGGDEATRLNDLASRFQSASDSGSVDALKPQHPPQGGHHGHTGHYGGRSHGDSANGADSADDPSATLKQAMDQVFSLIADA